MIATLEYSMVSFSLPLAVIVRQVSATMDQCERQDTAVSIAVDRARTQQEGYVAALRELGIEVLVLPPDELSPDCCFVEDTAVVIGSHAVVTRPGAQSRQAEPAGVEPALQRWYKTLRMEPPATLDGGDVLRVSDRLFVGLSSRTNEAGARCLEEVAALDGIAVVRIEVAAGLHLKSSCSLVSPDKLIYAEGDLDVKAFRDAALQCVPVAEPFAANALLLGDTVLVSASCPRTARRFETELGLKVRRVEASEIHKADGALTCLSVRIPRPGTWCT